MRSLVFLEHIANDIRKGALGVLAKAAQLGEAHGIVVGEDVDALAEQAGRFGATKVHVVDGPAFADRLPQPRVDALAQIVRETGIENLFLGQSVLAADIAAALAARLDAGLNWQVVDVEERDGELVSKQLVLKDTVLVEAGWRSTPRIALFRAGAFDPVETGGAAETERVDVVLSDFSTATSVVDHTEEVATGPSLEDAEIIVAGGRGLGSPEAFTIVEECAKALGGAVGASRAVVDAGWYPYSAQVGQTGKTVSPKLYIACGISGAIQHKVGMQNSGTIIAINKDANAPIFEFCDLGVVADVHTVLPELTRLISEASADG